VHGDNQGQDMSECDERYARQVAKELARIAWDKSVMDRLIGPDKDDDDEVFLGPKGHW
jgi:hypothetical protein